MYAPGLNTQELLHWLEAQLGTPYLWGGRGDQMSSTGDQLQPAPYRGFDCWGLVACGVLAAGGPDWRAWWTDVAWQRLLPVAAPEPGDLVLYGAAQPTGPQDVEHVEVVVGAAPAISIALGAGASISLPGWRTIGARGGGRQTTTLVIAKRQGASVRHRENHLLRARLAGFRRLVEVGGAA